MLSEIFSEIFFGKIMVYAGVVCIIVMVINLIEMLVNYRWYCRQRK